MCVIEASGLTKDYKGGKGIFDVSFKINEGEVIGFLGPNGAGKTTTIRNLLGFIKPDSGNCKIEGLDCFKDAAIIQKDLGYLPAESSFFPGMTGFDFIKFIASLKGMKSIDNALRLIDYLELNKDVKIKNMSRGMKQKVAIVSAFMSNPKILILDEPTSGLDPLMQDKFVNLIKEEKKRKTTILMSSHIFEEVEKTCDKIIIIKDGKIAQIEDTVALNQNRKKHFTVAFLKPESAMEFAKNTLGAVIDKNVVRFTSDGNIDGIIKLISQYVITDLTAKPQTLEEYFMHFYKGEKND